MSLGASVQLWSGGDFDGDWECFQFRVQLQWDSGRLELEMFSDLFSCIFECTAKCTVRLTNETTIFVVT